MKIHIYIYIYIASALIPNINLALNDQMINGCGARPLLYI